MQIIINYNSLPLLRGRKAWSHVNLCGPSKRRHAASAAWASKATPKRLRTAPEMAAKAKADRKPPMKAYTDLSKQDVDGLVAYLSTLKKK